MEGISGTRCDGRTSNQCEEARCYRHPGAEEVFFFGLMITDADLRMTDGRSLEGHGVEPDELILVTGADLAAKRDPVLSRGAQLLGVSLPAEKAGAMFPHKWPKD